MTLPVTFTLTSPTPQAAAPFVVGHAFKKGDVPSGSSVAVAGATAQVTPKNAWPDGSLKFAIIAGTAALTADVPATVTLSVGSASTGTALTTASLPAGLTASIDAGAFGSASWSGTDWNSPFQWAAGQTAWVSGHRMSSWLYRKQIGSDAHLVAWLEVRLFAGGAVEILPWVENGYLKVAGPTSKSATYTFALNGTEKFSAAVDIPNRCRTVLINGSAMSYWVGTDPQVTPKHDTAYLQGTALVPAYSAVTPDGAGRISTLPVAYAPLQKGSYPNNMGDAGPDPSIGLLPEWDVFYLTSQDPKAYAGVIFNGYSAGRYSIHFRDETTNRPLKFSSHPTLGMGDPAGNRSNLPYSSGSSSTGNLTPADTTGTWAQAWTTTHHPSIGFVAYLVSGRFYFLEELQFAATIQYLKNGDTIRSQSKGIIRSDAGANTTRGAAWGLRTLAQVASITPDDDSLRAEFLNSLEENINYYHGYPETLPNDPFGMVNPHGDLNANNNNKYEDRCWQQDFFTAATGYALAMAPSLPSGAQTKLDTFFRWKARSAIGRLGGTSLTEWLYRDAAQYDISLSPSDDYSVRYTDWGALYLDTFGVPNPGVVGDLRGEHIDQPDSYWNNLLPAISYAVQHGVTGALTAYHRMVDAGNWHVISDRFNSDPTWSVKPLSVGSAPVNAAISKTYFVASGKTAYCGRTKPVTESPSGAPTWWQGLAVNQAIEIPNSAPSILGKETGFNLGGSSGNWIDYWCGLSIDTRTSRIHSFGNGGHGDYFGNENNMFDLELNAPQWAQLLATSPPSVVNPISADSGAPYYPDGRPVSVHSYYQQQFIEARNRAARFPTGATAKVGYGHPACASFNILTNTCDAEGTYLPNAPATNYAEFGPVCKISDLRTGVETGTEDVYMFNKNSAVYKWTQATNTFSTVALPATYPPSAMNDYQYWASAYDPVRNRILLLNFIAYTFDVSTRVFTSVTPTGSAAASVMNQALGLIYEPALDKFIVKTNDEKFYLIDPATFAVTQIAVVGNTGMAVTHVGVFNKLLYVPRRSGVVYVPRYSSNVWFLRTH